MGTELRGMDFKIRMRTSRPWNMWELSQSVLRASARRRVGPGGGHVCSFLECCSCVTPRVINTRQEVLPSGSSREDWVGSLARGGAAGPLQLESALLPCGGCPVSALPAPLVRLSGRPSFGLTGELRTEASRLFPGEGQGTVQMRRAERE